MPQIEMREGKVLKLINVLSRKVPSEELLHQDKYISMMMTWLKAKGYQTMGPLIMYSSGVKGVNAEGVPDIDTRIMVQLQNSHIRLELPYKFEQELRVTDCLLARFNDHPDKLQFATNKLTLYAYEHDIELTGETYMVLLEQQADKLLADVFMPTKTTN